MTMETQNGYGAQALDGNVLGKLLGGSAVLSGCTPSVGANALEIDVASGTAVVDGSQASVSAQTVTLDAGDPSPRKDVVYVDATGAAQVAKGVAESPKPSNATGRTTYRPSPPDLHATAAAVVAEVWIPADASDVTSEDVTDRRAVAAIPGPFVDALGNFAAGDQLSGYPLGNGDVNALANFSAGDQLSGYPLALGGDTDADLAGTDLADGGTTVWDASAGDVPQAVLGGPASSLSAYPLVAGTDTDSAVDVGYVVADTSNSTPYTQSVTTGFAPRYVEFYGNLHQAAVGSLYYSGANSGGGDNAISYSEGYAAGSATGDQVVSMVADNSGSVNAHRTYVGDGEVVYLIESSNKGETLDGEVRANLSSLDSDGFTLEWIANYEAAPVVYRAFR